MSIKKKILVLVLITGVAGTSGCAAWFQQFKDNPVATLQQGVGYISNAVSLARVAFSLLAGAVPAVAAVTPQFETIVGRVDQGIGLAMDGLRIAAVAQGPAPDANALLNESRSALIDLQSFMNSLPGQGPGRAASPEMQNALHALETAAQPVRY
jgi:hypothetical protein